MRTVGVLLIHGFTGGPYEVEPFAEYIQQHTGWVVETPTLSGHGQPEQLHLKNVKAEKWIQDVEYYFEALQKKVDDVIVGGFSMGGVLAVHLATKYQVKQLVLMSAAFQYIALPQLAEHISQISIDLYRNRLNENELFARYEMKLRYVPFSATLQFMRVVKLIKFKVFLLNMPVIIVQGQNDGIVPVKTVDWLASAIPTDDKWMYISESAKHHICYSDDNYRWFELALQKMTSQCREKNSRR